MPSGVPLLSSVWQMKRKRKPSTGEISKYKARLNVNERERETKNYFTVCDTID
jgi:hypothetical protein